MDIKTHKTAAADKDRAKIAQVFASSSDQVRVYTVDRYQARVPHITSQQWWTCLSVLSGNPERWGSRLRSTKPASIISSPLFPTSWSYGCGSCHEIQIRDASNTIRPCCGPKPKMPRSSSACLRCVHSGVTPSCTILTNAQMSSEKAESMQQPSSG